MKFPKETKIGAIVALATALAFWGFNFLSGKNIFTSSKQYYAVFKNIGGLQVSSIVSSNGYTIGRVSDIQFIHGEISKIVVEVSVERQFTIPSNSMVEIYSTDFMGSKAVNLILGNSQVAARENDTLQGKFDGDISVLVTKKLLPIKEKGEHLMESIDSVMLILRNTFTPEAQRHIRQGLGSLDELMQTQKLKIDLVMNNLMTITDNLKKSNTQITKTLSNASAITDSLAAADLKETVGKADNLINETRLLIKKINENEGTLGKLINEDTAYNSLEKTIKDLDSLILDVKAHPKNYVHFSIFGKKSDK